MLPNSVALFSSTVTYSFVMHLITSFLQPSRPLFYYFLKSTQSTVVWSYRLQEKTICWEGLLFCDLGVEVYAGDKLMKLPAEGLAGNQILALASAHISCCSWNHRTVSDAKISWGRILMLSFTPKAELSFYLSWRSRLFLKWKNPAVLHLNLRRASGPFYSPPSIPSYVGVTMVWVKGRGQL